MVARTTTCVPAHPPTNSKKPNNLLKDHEHQVSEALLYPLEEYMKYVEEWFRFGHSALKFMI